MAAIVISDSSPLLYLILIGHTDILPALYSRLLIPQTVADELGHSSAPSEVRRWLANRPAWLEVVPSAGSDDVIASYLDPGEYEALQLAMALKADLVLMDDREGVEEARRLGLAVTGTLGVLARAADRGLIALAPAIERLRATNFRVHPALLDRLLKGRYT